MKTELANYIGNLIVTDGDDASRGSDDKAGIAEIMSAVRYVMEHPEFKHGGIDIIFTSDRKPAPEWTVFLREDRLRILLHGRRRQTL